MKTSLRASKASSQGDTWATVFWLGASGAIAIAIAIPAVFGALQFYSIYDGAITSSAGTFIRHGLIPYRDFWLLYGPLPSYMAALIGLVDRDTLVPVRIVGLLFVGLTAATAAWIAAQRIALPSAALVGVLGALVPIVYVGLDLAPWPLAMLLVVLAIAVGSREDRLGYLLAGTLCGLAGLARQDLGLFGLGAVVIAHRSAWPLVPALAMWIAVGIWLLAVVPVDRLWDQLVAFPVFGQAQYRSLDAPAPLDLLRPDDWLPTYLFYLSLGLIVATLVRSRRVRPDRLTGALILLAIVTRPQGIIRADGAHIAMTLLPCLLLAPFLMSGTVTSVGKRAVAGILAAPLVVLAIAILMVSPTPSPYAEAIQDASRIVGALTDPDEPIFVGLADNRHGYVNPLIVYHLADRPTGVRDSLYNPGVTTTAETQEAMITDLARNQVRFLVLDVRYAYCWEPANLSRLPGSPALDETIMRDFRTVADLGAVIIMARNDVSVGRLPAHVIVDPEVPREEGTLHCSRPN